MKSTAVFAVFALVMSAAFVFAVPAESDAVDLEYDREVYCYGDNPTFKHPMYESMNIDWTFTGYDENGNVVSTEGDRNESDQSYTVSLAGISYGIIVQTVSHPLNTSDTDQQTMLVHAMHIGDEVYEVRFWNGSQIIDTFKIWNETVVEVPGYFAMLPTDPTREGFVFDGWYTDSSFVSNSKFDPTQPITGDVDVYAKWTPVSTPSGDSGRVEVNTYTVTFQCDTGLTYNVLSNTGGTITFEVLEESGYDVIWSTVAVNADMCDVTYSNGVYTISGIHSDVIVLITGEYATSSNPNDSEGEGGSDLTMYAIILVIVAIICIALAVYIMRTRGSRV